jgi:hypothetical protein
MRVHHANETAYTAQRGSTVQGFGVGRTGQLCWQNSKVGSCVSCRQMLESMLGDDVDSRTMNGADSVPFSLIIGLLE